MRLAIRFMGLEILALEATDEPPEQHPDLGSDYAYADPEHPFGFTLPSTEWTGDDDE